MRLAVCIVLILLQVYAALNSVGRIGKTLKPLTHYQVMWIVGVAGLYVWGIAYLYASGW